MKTLYFLILTLLIATGCFATTITAKTNNGRWSRSSDWNLNRTPLNGDTVMIPSLINFKVDENDDLNGVIIIIKGTLTFTNGKLRLDRHSRVFVELGGRITGGGNNDQIVIENTFVYRGTHPDVIGFAFADITTGNGFSGLYSILPVEFVSFKVVKSANGVVLNWATSNEVNNNYFEILKSTDGRNWSVIGKVTASSSTNPVNRYEFIDFTTISSNSQYRIRQVDMNGKSSLSSIQSIQSTGKSNVRMYKTGNQLVVELGKTTPGTLNVRIVGLNGQMINQFSMNGTASKIMLPINSSMKGIYVVQLIEGNSNHSQKVAL